MSEAQDVDGASKLQLWKEVAGGKTRGRCYGTADLSSNIRLGVSSLTRESRAPVGLADDPQHSDDTEALRHEAITARQEAVQANQRAAQANKSAEEANQRSARLEHTLQTVLERMAVLERQSGVGSTSASQAQQVHPHYDDDLDDQPLDDPASRPPRHLRR